MKKSSLAVIALIICLSLVGCSQKSANDYTNEANKALQQQAFQEAIVALKNAISLQPNNLQARQQLAHAHLMVGNAKSALKELNIAGVLETDKNETLPLLSKGLLLDNENEQVLLVKFDELTNKTSQADVLLDQAVALMRLKRPLKSKVVLNQIVELVPNSKHSELASLYLKVLLNDAPMQQILDLSLNVVKDYPRSFYALQLAGSTATLVGENKVAVEIYAQFAKHFTYYPPAQFYLLDAYNRNEQFDETVSLGLKMLGSYPNNSYIEEILGLAYYRKGKLEDAKLYIEKAIQSGRDADQNLMLAGVTNYRLNKAEQAYGYLKSVKPFLPNDHPARKMLAALEIQFGYTNEADLSIESIDDFNDGDTTLLLSNAFSLLTDNQLSAAREQLNQLEGLNLDNSADLLKFGLLQFSLDKSQGLTALENAVQQNKNDSASLSALAMAYIAVGELDKALDISASWQQSNPQHPGGYNMAGLVYANKGMVNEAERAFKQALEVFPENVSSIVFFANKYLKDGDYVEAEKMASKLIELKPEMSDAHVINYRVQSKLKQPDKAIKMLENTVDTWPSPQNLILLSRLHFTQGDYQSSLKVLLADNLSDLKTKPVIYWQLLKDNYLRTGNTKEAETAIAQWLQTDTDNPVAWMTKIDFDKVYKSPQEVLKTVSGAQKALPNDANFKIVEFSVLVDLNESTKASALLNSLPNILRANPLTQLNESKLLAKEGKYSEALEKALKSYEQVKSNTAAVIIASVYLSLDQDSKAEEFMRNHLETSPNDLKVRHVLANHFLLDDFDKALKEYELILAIAPNDLAALNNCAWLALQTKQFEPAIAYIEKAIKLDSNQVDILDTAGQIYIATNRKEDALRVLELAVKLSKGSNAIKVNYEKAKSL
jgi:putative PEP-CTERM system TPR-repeat lipoprotein